MEAHQVRNEFRKRSLARRGFYAPGATNRIRSDSQAILANRSTGPNPDKKRRRLGDKVRYRGLR